MKNIPLKLMSLSIALLVAGCGGGGGGSTNTPGTIIPTAAVKITSSNAKSVAAGANTAAQSTANQGSSTTSQVVKMATQQTGHRPSVLQIATTEFNKARVLPIPAATAVGAATPSVFDCAGNPNPGSTNTMTFSYSMAGSTFAAGDSFTISFNNCVESSLGVTMNGSMTYAVKTLNGTLGQSTSASYTLTFANLSTKDNTTNATQSINGDMTLSAAVSGTAVTSTISGSKLTMVDSVEGSFELSNYNETVMADSTGPYSYSANMTVASTAMNGSVTIVTDTLFTGNINNNGGNPTAGQMTITGAAGSSLTMLVNPTGITYSGTDGTATFGPTDVAWANL